MAEKKCPHCATMIPEEAKICPNCRKKQGTNWIVWVFLGLIVLYAIGKISATLHNSSTSDFLSQSSERSTEGPLLELQTWHWGENYSYAIAEGTVKNISGHRLEGVTAIVQFYDRNSNFITSADSVIDYNPILPDQTSPFKVITTYNPEMKKGRLEFKYLMGGTIKHTEKVRHKKK